MKNKKGVNAIIGYVLLIAVVISMGAFVYQWMKSYVPKDIAECPEEISITIKDVTCTNNLKFTLKNTGLFNIDGYYLKGAITENQELATINLKRDEGYFELNNVLEPGEEIVVEKAAGIYKDTYIHFFDIIPIKFQEDDEGKTKLSVCGNAKVKEITGQCLLK